MSKPIAFTVPVLPGKAAALRALARALGGPRAKEFDDLQKRFGTEKEVWFLQPSPDGDTLTAYFECQDPMKVMTEFAASKNKFDLWFKGQMKEITGIDFNEPPSGPLPDLVFQYQY